MALAKHLSALALASLMALPLARVPAKAAGSVDVEADAMEIIDAEHKTIFTGNVVAKRPSDTTKADQMVITSVDQKQGDGSTKSVTSTVDAKGNVVITTKTATITGEWAKFDVLNEHLVVGGENVSLVQGFTNMKGKQLDIDLKTNHVQMTGGRVNGSFLPK